MTTKRDPFAITLAVLAVWTGITSVGSLFQFGGGKINLDDLVSHSINIPITVAAAILLGVVAAFGWWREVGLKAVEPPRAWLLGWVPLILICLIFGAATLSGLPPMSEALFIVINTIMVGVSEELMFRGLILYGALSRFSIWKAILITSLLFGAVHVLNGFITGNFGTAIVQAVAAMMSGFWFIALRLRTKSLYPPIILHALWDCGLFLMQRGMHNSAAKPSIPSVEPTMFQTIIAPILFATPLFLYGLWLLRGIGKSEKSEFLT